MSRIDIYHSRRNMHQLCAFWTRDESGIGNSEAYDYKDQPDGYFYAKEITPETVDNNVLFSTFMADQHHTMLESTDDLEGLTENSRVLFKDQPWRVDSIQKHPIIKETEFCKFETFYWYVQLVRQ